LSNRQSILIVEDDAALRLLWRTTLRYEGFDVIEAGDGIEALRYLEQHRPDLVLLDLGLPRLDGLSVQQEIAAQASTQQIPVVIVTASPDDLSQVNVPCVLRKPVTTDELLATVRRCLVSGAPGVGI
jgi:DNA-binding response OmpR family regulator